MVIADIIGGAVTVVLVVFFGIGWYMMVTDWPARARADIHARAEALIEKIVPQIREVQDAAKKPCECAQYKCYPCKARMVLQWWDQRDKEEVELKQIPWWRRPKPKFAKPPWETA